MAYRPVSAIEVRCWGKRVGVVAPDPVRGGYAFEYYPDFSKTGIELSPLLLPVSTKGAVVSNDLPEATYYRLPAFIADSLPDKFGNALIDAWMARNGLSYRDFTVLDRLAYVGSRAMGALEFVPAIKVQGSSKPSAIDAKQVVEAARRALTLSVEDLAQDSSAALAQLMQVGTSAGGAKAKAIIGYNPQDGRMVSGQFDLPEDYEPWLLKIDTSENRPYGEIEYAYSLMAKACGINMTECDLLDVNGKRHFMTKRFDRLERGERLHMQTLCAIAGMDYNLLGAHDYLQLFDVARRLGLEDSVIDELFVRMVFNVCMANNDDHAKNHSFTLRQGGSWMLAPAYDLMHACNPANIWLARHSLAVQGKREGITREDLLKTGDQVMARKPGVLIDRVLAVADSWDQFAGEAGLKAEEVDLVGSDIKACAQLLKS